MNKRRYDLVAMGRSSIDLYSNDIGAAFSDIKSFGAFVGGCPTNVSVGARRLGLRTALLTAVGDDPVGDFVLAFLKREGVDISCVPRKEGRRTSAVLLGIERMASDAPMAAALIPILGRSPFQRHLKHLGGLGVVKIIVPLSGS